MNRAYLLTGGNIGNREQHLAAARAEIEDAAGRIVRASHLYETGAWGKTDQPAFLNQALELDTELTARQLIRRLLKIEKIIGRVRDERYGPRVIDIDILLFNQEIHDYPLLHLPHPELPNRRFALVPLAELAADLVHPILQRSIASLLQSCSDPLPVRRVD